MPNLLEKSEKEVLGCKGGNTSNLFSHLWYHHPKEFAKMREPRIKPTDNFETGQPRCMQ